jgi:hypothetical protein
MPVAPFMHSTKRKNPEGISSQSPGLRGTSYPGKSSHEQIQPWNWAETEIKPEGVGGAPSPRGEGRGEGEFTLSPTLSPTLSVPSPHSALPTPHLEEGEFGHTYFPRVRSSEA